MLTSNNCLLLSKDEIIDLLTEVLAEHTPEWAYENAKQIYEKMEMEIWFKSLYKERDMKIEEQERMEKTAVKLYVPEGCLAE